jgi:membrane carboxypeptidase/penicillin-binding protein PbpC
VSGSGGAPGRAGRRGRRVFFPETAFLVTDMLADPAARMVAFGAGFPGNVPFPYALKTGTSTQYRDGWAVAYTTRYTVAVWVGNFDGSPTAGISGGWGASPIAGEILSRLHGRTAPPPFRPPPGVVSAAVCGISGMAPSPGCAHVTREWFVAGAEPEPPCALHAARGAEPARYDTVRAAATGEAHLLPAPYARWVAQRQRRGAAGGLSTTAFDPLPEEEAAEEGTVRMTTGGGTAREAVEGSTAREAVEGRGGRTASEARAGEAGSARGAEGRAESPPSRGRLAVDEGAEPGVPPLGPSSPRLEIAYPLPRDRFVLDRGLPAPSIRLDAVVPEAAPYVEWYVDGRFLARAAPPYSARWTLFPGSHRITASAPGFAGDSIRVAVE